LIKPGRVFRFVSRGTFTLPGGADNPVTGGGTLCVESSSTGRTTYVLDQAAWTGLGPDADGSKGFRFRGTTCRAIIRETVVRGVCRRSTGAFALPETGDVAIVLAVGDGPRRYCGACGGTPRGDPEKVFRRTECDPPGACACLTATTSSTTSSSTSTSSTSTTSTTAPPCPGPFTGDNFDDGTTDPCEWAVATSGGTGPSIGEVGGKLRISIPGNSTFPPSGVIGAEYRTGCLLQGDFDVTVEYWLTPPPLTWPASNGVRIALRAAAGNDLAERVSLAPFPTDQGQYSGPREVYLTDFDDGVQGFADATGHLAGVLRLTRIGSTVTGYYWNGSAWVVIHSYAPTSTADTRIVIAAFTNSAVFQAQNVVMAFDNFIVNPPATWVCP
jgi:hypothetical protein